jgi:SNF2 family DNA or RNA helicase
MYGSTPAARRVLVICPGSLVKNWAREFNKWLGKERIKVFCVSTRNSFEEYAASRVYPVSTGAKPNQSGWMHVDYAWRYVVWRTIDVMCTDEPTVRYVSGMHLQL